MVFLKFLFASLSASISYLLIGYFFDGRSAGIESYFTPSLLFKAFSLGIVIAGMIFMIYSYRLKVLQGES